MAERQVWHPERIKAELRIKGTSLAEIARTLNISNPVVSCAIRYSNRRSRRVESAVAKALGVSPAAIWPDRYRKSRSRANAGTIRAA